MVSFLGLIVGAGAEAGVQFCNVVHLGVDAALVEPGV